jgi:pSer/pThr/pTyr-binding forkhead associated (FHA) protein
MAFDPATAGSGPVGSAVGWLVPLDGPQTGELFQIKGKCVIGKAPDCDVVLNDPSISGRHVEVICGRGGARLTDLGSTNGTYVNDKRVSNADLVDNDTVRLGRTNFKFKSMS